MEPRWLIEENKRLATQVSRAEAILTSLVAHMDLRDPKGLVEALERDGVAFLRDQGVFKER